eukprot:2889149-Prymnesium_polylepis.1
MALAGDELWCKVLWRAAQGMRLQLRALGEPEVDELRIAVRVQHNILGLEVAVDYMSVVHETEAGDDASDVETRFFLREGVLLAHVRVQLATKARLEHHKQSIVRLKGPVHLADRRKIDVPHDGALAQDLPHRLFLHQLAAHHLLHDVNGASCRMLDDGHACERTGAHDHLHSHILQRHIHCQTMVWIAQLPVE